MSIAELSDAVVAHWVAGKPFAGTGTRRGAVYDPATGARAREVALASAADVDEAVAAAATAFAGWRQASLSQRTRVLFAYRELLNAQWTSWRRSSRPSTARSCPTPWVRSAGPSRWWSSPAASPTS